jgi:hypothetical protein
VQAVAEAIGPTHERWQGPGADEQWSDSFYFGGGDGRGLAFYSRIGRRPNEGIVEGALGLWLPAQGFLLSFARERIGTDPERASTDTGSEAQIACGAVRFDCRQPLLLWELSFSGQGRLYKRAEHLATDRESFRNVDVDGLLRFTAWCDPLSFRSGIPVGVADAHYEQPGSIAGALEVDGRRRGLSGHALRDHSWGVRDWQGVPYWRWFGLVVDPDTFLLVNNVGRRDGGESAGGYLCRDGVLAPVVACETESELDPELGCQRSFTARVEDEQGRKTVLSGRALEVAPLRQRREGRLTHVNEALTQYRWEGHGGIGISEYLVQQQREKEPVAKGDEEPIAKGEEGPVAKGSDGSGRG